MSLINRERLIETICGTVSEVAMTAPYDSTWFTRMARRQFEIIKIIENMPAVTLVSEFYGKQIVHCKDCKHCDPENRHCDHPMGTTLPVPRKADDFCSYGERRSDD